VATTTSELFVASSTDLVSANDRTVLAGVDDEDSYFPNALSFVLTGCLIILLAFGCGIIRLDTTILCLSIFQAVILEYNYQMISSFIAVMMNYLVMIFASSNVDLDDVDEIAKDEELAVSTLRSLRLDMLSSASSDELVDPSYISFDTIIVSSDTSPCLVVFFLLMFASMVGIVGVLIIDRIDWLGLLSLVGSMMIISTDSEQLLGSDVETTINTSMSSASSDDIDTYHPADDTHSQSKTMLALSNWKEVVQLLSPVPFNLMDTLRAHLSSVLQFIFYERHSLLVAFLLMVSAPILVMVAVLMVLDFWTILQALVVAACLFHITTYVSKALQPTLNHLGRVSASTLVGKVCRFEPITTICNIATDESCLLALLLMVIVPLMGIAVIMMILIVTPLNWSLVVQDLAECMMMILSCVPSVRQACSAALLMMGLKIITYYLLRLWHYQLLIAFDFLDVIGVSGLLVNIMSRLFDCISYALTYYDGGSGDGLMDTTRGMFYSAITCTVNSIWMILAWVASIIGKKFVYCIASKTSILLVRVCIMLVWTIDIKTAVYTLVAYLIRLPTNIIWRLISRASVIIGCIVCFTNNKLFLQQFNRVEQKELLLPPAGVTVSDDEDSDDDSTIDFGATDPNDDFHCVDVPSPPLPPKRHIRRPRKKYPPAVWHRGRGGRGGRLRPRTNPG